MSPEQARALPREDWQWLADQLRAWPQKRVHPERTMCDGALRPMAADVIEAALSALSREPVHSLHELQASREEQVRAEERWQDIATAPKDGTDLLAWCPDYGMRQTRMGRYQPGSPGYAVWERGDGPRNHGWVWIEEKHNSAHSWKPTHWRPLPAPPAIRSAPSSQRGD